jgi:hypothetical protein
VGGITKNQLRQIKNCWATHTHTQCTAVISFCFFLGFDFPGEITIILSPPAVRMKEKRTVPTRNYTQPGRLQTQMIDRPAEKEIRFKKRAAFPLGHHSFRFIQRVFFYY